MTKIVSNLQSFGGRVISCLDPAPLGMLMENDMSGPFQPPAVSVTPARFSGEAAVSLIDGFITGVVQARISLGRRDPVSIQVSTIMQQLVRPKYPNHSYTDLREEVRRALEVFGRKGGHELKKDEQGLIVACQLIV